MAFMCARALVHPCAKLTVRADSSRPTPWRKNCSVSHKEDERGKLQTRAGKASLDDIEPGKICGAVIPMSERAQTQMRDSIEVIDYLLNQERVVWS